MEEHMTSKWENYYNILGIEFGASPEEIRNSYVKLAKKYHPDLCKGKNTTSMMAKINGAYEALMNETKRRRYADEYQNHYPSKPISPKYSSKYTNKDDNWYDIILTCQETADQIIAMKKIIISLKQEKAIDFTTYFKAIGIWHQMAKNYLTKLIEATKKANSLHCDTIEVEEARDQIILAMWTIYENPTTENMEKKHIF